MLAEHLGRTGVLHLPLTERQVVVDRGLDERVHEAERQVRTQHLGARQGRDRLGGDVVVVAGHRGDDRQRRAAAEHRDRAGHVAAGLGHPAQPHLHHARHRPRPDRAHRVGVRGVGADALGLQGPQQLPQQQRVARRRTEAGADERVVGLLQPVADHGGGAVRAQRARPHVDRVGVAGDLLDELLVGVALTGPPGRHHQQGQPLEPTRQVAEEAQRAGVAPLHVVDGDHHGRAAGEVAGQPVQPVQRREHRVGLRADQRGGVEDPVGSERGAGEQVGARLGRGQHRVEQLPHHPESELPLQLAAATAQHGGARCARLAADQVEQGRLADPGRALDDGQPRDPVERRAQARAQPGGLRLAVHQQGPGTRR